MIAIPALHDISVTLADDPLVNESFPALPRQIRKRSVIRLTVEKIYNGKDAAFE